MTLVLHRNAPSNRHHRALAAVPVPAADTGGRPDRAAGDALLPFCSFASAMARLARTERDRRLVPDA